MAQRHTKWLIWASPLLLLLLISGVLAGVLWARHADSSTASGDAGEAASLVVVSAVLGEGAPPPIADTYRGMVIASKEAELAFRRAGRVRDFHVREGAYVQAGQLLAELDARDIEARLAAAQAEIQQAEALLAELLAGPRKQVIAAAEAEVRRLEAAVQLASATTQRQRRLMETNAVSRQEYDEARFALDQQSASLAAARHRLEELQEGTRLEQIEAQKARLEVLRANLASLQVDREDCRLEAPFPGVISRRYLDEGVVVGPESRALRVLQVDPLEARFGVSPRDASQLHVGEKAVLTIDGVPLVGTVDRIEPEVDLATRTQGLYITIPASDSIRLVPGRTISLSLGVREGEAGLWVPVAALSRAERGLWSLFVLEPLPNGLHRVERREVQVVGLEAEWAQVSGGLIRRGEQYVVQGLHRVTPGMKVQVAQP